MQALVSSGGGRAWPLIMQQSEGSENEMEVGVRVEISGSETSAGLGRLGQMKTEKGRRAAEHLQRDASIGMLERQER